MSDPEITHLNPLPTADECYQALVSRDARFDGLFYTGVLTTGIYCRSVCPAPKPKAENCRYFHHAAQAESAGFRPCLKCRPEQSPGSAWMDRSHHSWQQLSWLMESEPDLGVSQLAERLGMTDRHLRRIVQQHTGMALQTLITSRRLLLAKTLLTDTQQSVTDIALQAGFGSLRRLQDAMQQHYQLSPSDLRKKASRESTSAGSALFTLGYRPPYDWAHQFAFLAQRRIEGVEYVQGVEDSHLPYRYVRTARVQHQGQWLSGWIAAEPNESRHQLRIEISESLLPAAAALLAQLKHLFDLEARIVVIETQLGPLAANYPGTRLPGAFNGFEMAVRTVLGQQISITNATKLCGKVAALGPEVQSGLASLPAHEQAALRHYFPTEEEFQHFEQSRLGELGVIRQRSKALLALAQAMTAGDISLHPGANPELTRERLLALPGIGPWSANYILMRALHYPDAWPDWDYVLKMRTGLTTPKALREHMEAFRPWRAYATLHIWRNEP
ncbi:Ada metal-binding domain-containing protein [Pokkaliibacter sp. CJK22405]|uniref:DNA-3-methyladenine glycosylase 2 family protein n=1 Tax=Pokkaliibacter sp. CJK22405 TaxID=3384615 RepID=UPI003985626E